MRFTHLSKKQKTTMELDLLFNDDRIQPIKAGLMAINSQLSDSNALMLAQALLAKKEVINSLPPTQQEALVSSAIDTVCIHGAASLPVLQELWEKIASGV